MERSGAVVRGGEDGVAEGDEGDRGSQGGESSPSVFIPVLLSFSSSVTIHLDFSLSLSRHYADG